MRTVIVVFSPTCTQEICDFAGVTRSELQAAKWITRELLTGIEIIARRLPDGSVLVQRHETRLDFYRLYHFEYSEYSDWDKTRRAGEIDPETGRPFSR